MTNETSETSEMSLLTSELSAAESTLQNLGYKHDQSLMRVSISYWDHLFYFYKAKEEFGSDVCDRMIFVSDTHRQYCFYE
jgi:hypothetical protein